MYPPQGHHELPGQREASAQESQRPSLQNHQRPSFEASWARHAPARPQDAAPPHELQPNPYVWNPARATPVNQPRPEILYPGNHWDHDRQPRHQQLPGLRELLSPSPLPPHPPPPRPAHSPFPSFWSNPDQASARLYQPSPAPGPYVPPQNQLSDIHAQQEPPLLGLAPGRSIELPILDASARLDPCDKAPSQSAPRSPFGDPQDRSLDQAAPRPSLHDQQRSISGYTVPTSSGLRATTDTADASSPVAGGSLSVRRPSKLPPAGSGPGPKYIGQRDIPGEGLCHVYDNGTRCPAVIDGESVNPIWGTTKAGKARKRLAQACLDCREKKIRCEPGIATCVQCEKAKRTCRRAPSQPTPIDTSRTSGDWTASDSSPTRTRVSDPIPPSHQDTMLEPLKKRRRSTDLQQSFQARPERSVSDIPKRTVSPKRARSVSPTIASRALAGLSNDIPGRRPQATPSPTEDDKLALRWADDPFLVDPDTTLHLLDLYFVHVNSATYCMFPPKAFTRWVKTCKTKDDDERMVLYAVLAMGSIFAERLRAPVARRCADIATQAVARNHGSLTLLLVQSRLLLALYDFARGEDGKAWDHCGSAIRALSGVHLNTEHGCSGQADGGKTACFDMSPAQATECRRRTFWSGFLMDRYNGFCGGTLCTIHLEDIFLRLPCPEHVYENGTESQAPFFDNGIIDPAEARLTPGSAVGAMGHLAVVSSIWGDVSAFLHRSVHRAPSHYAEAYDQFYKQTHRRLDEWMSRLPAHLHHTQQNTERSIREGYAGTLISLFALHHITLMKLNRIARHALLPRAT
ncbi:hypothetical protein LTR66_007887, partial [Elasticomyces elasticus]